MKPGEDVFEAELADLLEESGAAIVPHALLSDYTTLQLGGVCPALIDCRSLKSFLLAWEALVHHGVRPLLIGGGSNLLVSDDGIADIVVRYQEDEPFLLRDGSRITVSAGASLDGFVRQTVAWGLAGLVSCSGIPGTVGGAVAGNAGAFGDQIGDRIVSVDVMDRDGHVRSCFPDSLGFGYRRSAIPASGGMIVSVVVQLDQVDADGLLARRQEILDLRATKHPDWRKIPTAGSFFKNIEPTSKAERRQAAGWYLEQAGALNMKVGGARTFERHANIIVAEKWCRASDVFALSEMMAAAVKDKFQIALEREVKLVGAFA